MHFTNRQSSIFIQYNRGILSIILAVQADFELSFRVLIQIKLVGFFLIKKNKLYYNHGYDVYVCMQ